MPHTLVHKHFSNTQLLQEFTAVFLIIKFTYFSHLPANDFFTGTLHFSFLSIFTKLLLLTLFFVLKIRSLKMCVVYIKISCIKLPSFAVLLLHSIISCPLFTNGISRLKRLNAENEVWKSRSEIV